MHARPEVKEILLKKKMRKWLNVARHYSRHEQTRARRNFLRLVERYPAIAAELGLSVASAYE